MQALPALSETDATCKIACLPPLLSRIWSAEYSRPFSLLSFAAIADRSSNVPFVSVYLTKAKHHTDAKALRRPRGCLCAIASVLLCWSMASPKLVTYRVCPSTAARRVASMTSGGDRVPFPTDRAIAPVSSECRGTATSRLTALRQTRD